MKVMMAVCVWICLGCMLLVFSQDCVRADEFEPPVIDGEPDIFGEDFSTIFSTEKGPDYTGRRFHATNGSRSHNIIKSDLFKEGFALYELPAKDTSRYQTTRHRIFIIRHLFLGRERFSDTAGFLQPEFIREVKTLNDVAGFVTIKNKKDAIEYVRLASSPLTGVKFSPWMDELFCVRKLPDNPRRILNPMGTLDECERFGLGPPEVKKLKKPDLRIESDTSGSRFNLTTKPSRNKTTKEDDGDGDEVDDDKDEGKAHDRIVFHVTRNVVIDSEFGIFRVTEEVGSNGEWSIVAKRLIQPFSEEVRFLLGGRMATDTSGATSPPEKRKQKDKREEKPEHILKKK